jgi:hypothetical protein
MGSGTLGLAAAILTTVGVAYFTLAEFAGAGLSGWGFTNAALAGMVLGIVAFACVAVATLDTWLALSSSRRRPARSYLRGAGVLLAVACLAAGPLLAVPLLPGLVLTWLAYAQLKPQVPASTQEA